MRNRRPFSTLVPLTVAGMTALLAAGAVPSEDPAAMEPGHASHAAFFPGPCEDCHYCPWDSDYAQIGYGISMAQTDADILSPEVCFYWSWCDGCDEEEAPEEADLALSDLLYGEGMTVSEWVEANSSRFRFRTVEGTLEVASYTCGSVLAWIPLDDTEEVNRIRAIIAQQ